jgi:hypothetical protein
MLCSREARRRDSFGVPSPSLRVFGCAKILGPCLIHPDFLALPGRSGCPPEHGFSHSFTSPRIGCPSHV